MNRMEEEAEAARRRRHHRRAAHGEPRRPIRTASQWQQYRAWSKWAKQLGFRRPQTRHRPAAGSPAGQQLARPQWQQWCTADGLGDQVPLPPWAQPTAQASYSLGANTAEFIAIGTAVRHRDGRALSEQEGQAVPVGPVGGQDFWMLIRTGFRPVGFVMGNCVYYVPPQTAAGAVRPRAASSPRTRTRSTTRASSRSSACKTRPRSSARPASSASPSPRSSTRGGRTRGTSATRRSQTGEVIELFVIGTAVVPTERRRRARPTPQLVLLGERRRRAEGRRSGE